MLPFLRWLDIGYEKAMKRAAKEINHLPHMLLEDHKRKRAAGTHQEAQDFIDVMLRFLGQSKMDLPDSRQILSSKPPAWYAFRLHKKLSSGCNSC